MSAHPHIDFDMVRAAGDERGGEPMDRALAMLSEWQRQKRCQTRLLLGLSAIGTGLQSIERGKVDQGAASVRAGFEFLRKELGR